MEIMIEVAISLSIRVGYALMLLHNVTEGCYPSGKIRNGVHISFQISLRIVYWEISCERKLKWLIFKTTWRLMNFDFNVILFYYHLFLLSLFIFIFFSKWLNGLLRCWLRTVLTICSVCRQIRWPIRHAAGSLISRD